MKRPNAIAIAETDGGVAQGVIILWRAERNEVLRIPQQKVIARDGLCHEWP
jgi:hypothetical protein